MVEHQFTKELLKEMQSWDLDKKIAVTLTRIKEFANHFPDGVYVSFSGGKDSTVLLDLVRKVIPDVPVVFIDTGLEYPELRNFALKQSNIIRLKPQMNFRKVIETYGYPLISKEVAQKIYEYRKNPNGYASARFNSNSEYNIKYHNLFSLEKWIWLRDSDIPISHLCCKIMKKKPLQQFEKETGLRPVVGTMACESRTRKTVWLRNGCNAFDTKRPISQPMSFWTEQDVLKYLRHYGIPYASVYGEIVEDKNGKLYTTGCYRTGCVFCGFGCHLEKEPTRFQKLHNTHPKLWDYCMKDLKDGGLGMGAVFDMINAEYGEDFIEYK